MIIFQVRPLAASIRAEKCSISDEEIFAAADRACQKYREIGDLLGEKNTILSDMAFWNPAEMIGENPV